MNDKQIAWLFHHGLSHHNGQRCGRVHYENGVGPHTICQGRTVIDGGKVRLHETCGEPCTFVCKSAEALAREVELVLFYDKILREAKEVCP